MFTNGKNVQNDQQAKYCLPEGMELRRLEWCQVE